MRGESRQKYAKIDTHISCVMAHSFLMYRRGEYINDAQVNSLWGKAEIQKCFFF